MTEEKQLSDVEEMRKWMDIAAAYYDNEASDEEKEQMRDIVEETLKKMNS